jgi:hypothetical protein
MDDNRSREFPLGSPLNDDDADDDAAEYTDRRISRLLSFRAIEVGWGGGTAALQDSLVFFYNSQSDRWLWTLW